MTVMFLFLVVLDSIWLRTSRHYSWWPWSLATVFLDICYAITLLPKGNAVAATIRHTNTSSETTSLLPPRYTHFHFDFNEAHLGHAQDEANFLSRFFFQWVGPLISKGVAGNLKRVDDLFDIPDALNIARISEKLHLSISQARTIFWALHKTFGREFYMIGILRFIADVTSFAGPLLLGGLLSQEPSSSSVEEENGEETTNWQPYLYALGLLATQLLCKFKII